MLRFSPDSKEKPGERPEWMGLSSKLRYGRSSEIEAHLLELPYHSPEDVSVSMLLVLPFSNLKCDFTGWVKSTLDWEKLMEIMEDMPETRVVVSIPKLELKSTFDLKSTLSSLGLETIFSRRANFTGMYVGDDSASISSFLHKAKV